MEDVIGRAIHASHGVTGGWVHLAKEEGVGQRKEERGKSVMRTLHKARRSSRWAAEDLWQTQRAVDDRTYNLISPHALLTGRGRGGGRGDHRSS